MKRDRYVLLNHLVKKVNLGNLKDCLNKSHYKNEQSIKNFLIMGFIMKSK